MGKRTVSESVDDRVKTSMIQALITTFGMLSVRRSENPPSPFLLEAAVASRWRLFRCDVVMFGNLLCVLETVLTKNQRVPKVSDSIIDHPGCRR